MTETYDPSNHLLAVAIIVFYWQFIRIWCQPPPPPDHRDKPAARKEAAWPASAFSDLIAPLWPAGRSAEARPASSLPAPAEKVSGPGAIRGADPSFDEASFLSGASRAYERVVEAYGNDDLATVGALLDPRVAGDLVEAIAARRKRGERRTFSFVGLKDTKIVAASTEAGVVEITVRFTSEAACAAWAADGSLIRGDPRQVVEMTDIWTFSRQLAARSPNWRVVATGGEQ